MKRQRPASVFSVGDVLWQLTERGEGFIHRHGVQLVNGGTPVIDATVTHMQQVTAPLRIEPGCRQSGGTLGIGAAGHCRLHSLIERLRAELLAGSANAVAHRSHSGIEATCAAGDAVANGHCNRTIQMFTVGGAVFAGLVLRQMPQPRGAATDE